MRRFKSLASFWGRHINRSAATATSVRRSRVSETVEKLVLKTFQTTEAMDRNIVLLLCLCFAVFQARGISLTRQGGNIVLITFALITNSVAPTHICFAASSQSSGNYCISMIWLKQLVSKVLFNLDSSKFWPSFNSANSYLFCFFFSERRELLHLRDLAETTGE